MQFFGEEMRNSIVCRTNPNSAAVYDIPVPDGMRVAGGTVTGAPVDPVQYGDPAGGLPAGLVACIDAYGNPFLISPEAALLLTTYLLERRGCFVEVKTAPSAVVRQFRPTRR